MALVPFFPGWLDGLMIEMRQTFCRSECCGRASSQHRLHILCYHHLIFELIGYFHDYFLLIFGYYRPLDASYSSYWR